jgi:hypothetical protein
VQTFDWRQADEEQLKHKFGILNAIYFPNGDYSALYETITPVNTFRVVFNQYFGQDVPLLPDSSHAYYSLSDLYSFRDVTDLLR